MPGNLASKFLPSLPLARCSLDGTGRWFSATEIESAPDNLIGCETESADEASEADSDPDIAVRAGVLDRQEVPT